ALRSAVEVVGLARPTGDVEPEAVLVDETAHERVEPLVVGRTLDAHHRCAGILRPRRHATKGSFPDRAAIRPSPAPGSGPSCGNGGWYCLDTSGHSHLHRARGALQRA